METGFDSSSRKQLQREVGELNRAYMQLAQKLVKQDRATAMSRLGIGSELADLLVSMSDAQIEKIAGSNLVLCSFRPEEAAEAKSGVDEFMGAGSAFASGSISASRATPRQYSYA